MQTGHYDWESIRKNLWVEIKKERLTTESLAFSSGVNRKTLDNFLNGRSGLRLNTLKKIESALLRDLATGGARLNSTSSALAPAEFGGYSREFAKQFLGQYFLLRRSFDYADGRVCSLLTLSWHGDLEHMTFQETQRNQSRSGMRHDYDIAGYVCIPPGLAILQLIAKTNGFRRVATFSTMGFSRKSELKGVLLSINEIQDAGFKPACSPVLAIKLDGSLAEDQIAKKLGSSPISKCWRDGLEETFARIEGSFSGRRPSDGNGGARNGA